MTKPTCPHPERHQTETYIPCQDCTMAAAPAKKVKVKLIGEDGNAFGIMGRVKTALTRAGEHELAKSYLRDAMNSGSYDELLQVTMRYVDVY